jgi:hypothetical protein
MPVRAPSLVRQTSSEYAASPMPPSLMLTRSNSDASAFTSNFTPSSKGWARVRQLLPIIVQSSRAVGALRRPINLARQRDNRVKSRATLLVDTIVVFLTSPAINVQICLIYFLSLLFKVS